MSTTPRTDAAIHRADTISNASGLLRAKYKGLEMEYVSPDFVRQLETEIQQLTAKLADLMKDKQRLEWLKQNLRRSHIKELVGHRIFERLEPFEAKVDAAIAAEKEVK